MEQGSRGPRWEATAQLARGVDPLAVPPPVTVLSDKLRLDDGHPSVPEGPPTVGIPQIELPSTRSLFDAPAMKGIVWNYSPKYLDSRHIAETYPPAMLMRLWIETQEGLPKLKDAAGGMFAYMR